MKAFSFIILLLCSVNILAQESPVKWKFSSKKIADKTYEVHITASIDQGWHIYPQRIAEDAIAEPTTLTFNNNPLVSISGKPKEVGKLIKHHEEVLDMDVMYYQTKVDFVQVIKLKKKVKTNIGGKVEYMACTNERCLPLKEEKFSVAVEAK